MEDVTPQPISDSELEELKDKIHPLQDDDAYGINTYIQVCLANQYHNFQHKVDHKIMIYMKIQYLLHLIGHLLDNIFSLYAFFSIVIASIYIIASPWEPGKILLESYM